MWCKGLSLEEWEDNVSEDTLLFLHGKCHLWVIKNCRPGDNCIAITEYREEIESIGLLHACLFRNGKYLDVRGDTENFTEVIDAFDWGEYDIEMYETLEDFIDRMVELGL